MTQQAQIDALAWWVFSTKYQSNKSDCPKVGYLGYANGMNIAEWLAVNMAKDMLTEKDKDWREYFDYRIDSSD